MAAVSFSPVFNENAYQKSNGFPASGYKIFAYQAGSFSTLAPIYTTAEGNVQSSNPLVLDSSGRQPNMIWLVDGTEYNLVYTLPDGTTVVKSEDGIIGVQTPSGGGGGGSPNPPDYSVQIAAGTDFYSFSSMLINEYQWEDEYIPTLAVGANFSSIPSQISFGQDTEGSTDFATIIRHATGSTKIISRPSTISDTGDMSYPVNENLGENLEFIAGYSSTPPDACQGYHTITTGAQLNLNAANTSLSGFDYIGTGGSASLNSGSAYSQDGDNNDKNFGFNSSVVATGAFLQSSFQVRGGEIYISSGGATDNNGTSNLGANITLTGGSLNNHGEVNIKTNNVTQLNVTYPSTQDSKAQPTVVIPGTGIRISTSYTPSSSSAYGRPGQMAWDSNFFYICIANNSWKRIALSTF